MVQDFVEGNLKVWHMKVNDLGDRTVMPQLIPWLEGCMGKAAFSRSESEEGYLIFVNLTVLGVVSAQERHYTMQFVTDFLSTHRRNGIAVVVHANRAKKPQCSPRCMGQRLNFSRLLKSVLTKKLQIKVFMMAGQVHSLILLAPASPVVVFQERCHEDGGCQIGDQAGVG